MELFNLRILKGKFYWIVVTVNDISKRLLIEWEGWTGKCLARSKGPSLVPHLTSTGLLGQTPLPPP